MKSIKIPFSYSGGKTNSTSSLATIAEQKIIDLLTTDKYSRIMFHRYGGNTRSFLFDMVDDLVLTDFITDVKQEARDYLSRVEILDIRVTSPDKMVSYTSPETSVGITVYYRLPMGSPQILRFKVAVPGQLTEDSII
jgi:phage baseplate assembly protein W